MFGCEVTRIKSVAEGMGIKQIPARTYSAFPVCVKPKESLVSP